MTSKLIMGFRLHAKESPMTSKLIMCLAAALIGAACSQKPPPAAVTTTGAPGIVPNQDAIKRLSDARCQREQECNDIGADKDYKDLAHCTGQVSHDLEKDLHATECPRGIRDDKLSQCLAEIRNTKCGTSVGSVTKSIGRVVSSPCHTGSLCLE